MEKLYNSQRLVLETQIVLNVHLSLKSKYYRLPRVKIRCLYPQAKSQWLIIFETSKQERVVAASLEGFAANA